MNNNRDYLMAKGMASQERAYLAPPCPRPVYVECAWCGQELLDEDAVVYIDYLGDEYMMCSHECAKELHEETCDPEVE
jgi:YHS domain-containing protein